MTLINLEERQKSLSMLITQKEKALAKAPEGILKGCAHFRGYQYYCRRDKHDRNGTYIRKDQIRFAQKLGQKGYDQRVLASARKELRFLTGIASLYEKDKVEDVFEKIPLSHQKIVIPVEEPLDRYIAEWEAQEYDGQKFREDQSEFYTKKGERVRSKSEILIANMLEDHGIPYLYEKPLVLRSYGTIYPDFTILDVRTRQEIYWEHLGMLDNDDYLKKSMKKIRDYERNGYYPGDRLIITGERSDMPFDSRLAEAVLMNRLGKWEVS